MVYRATQVAPEPLNYFAHDKDDGPHLHVADIILRANQDPKEIFARMIRSATNSNWSHCSLLYMLRDPFLGIDNTFLIEAMTTGVRVTSWKKEVEPPERFTVAIKRTPLDWYVETPVEKSLHGTFHYKDAHGIAFLRHVRGIALDQIDGLYDQNVVRELTALYMERVFKQHVGRIPQLANLAASVASYFRRRSNRRSADAPLLRFICSGLVQYSFFEALRLNISNNLKVPEHRDAALSNLNNIHRIIFRPDPDGVIDKYIQQVKSGAYDIHAPAPNDVLDLLKTSTPADFNNSPNLDWRYVILRGVVWKIEKADDDYRPQNEEEQAVLELLSPEHNKPGYYKEKVRS